jgi:hypothetical protein
MMRAETSAGLALEAEAVTSHERPTILMHNTAALPIKVDEALTLNVLACWARRAGATITWEGDYYLDPE